MLELCTAKPSKAPDAPGPLLRCPGGGPKEPRTPESKEWNILTEEAQSEPHWAARRPLQSDRGIRVRQWGEREGGKVRFNRSNSKYKHACLVAQSCPTLLRPQGLQPIRPLCPRDSPGRNTGVGCHALLQTIFPSQGSNPGLPHCRQILNHLSYQGRPIITTDTILYACNMTASLAR